MTIRYLVLVDFDKARRQALAVRIRRKIQFPIILEFDNATLLLEDKKTCMTLPGNAGAVLGRIFSGVACPQTRTALTLEETTSIQRHGVRELFRRVWGAYLSLVFSQDDSTVTISRDPSGAVPVFYAQSAEGYIFSSDVNALFEAEVLKPTIDWAFIASHIRYFDVATPRTALVGVAEILPGFSLTIGEAKNHVQQDWSPWDYVGGEPRVAASKRPDQNLAHQLRDTIVGCATGLASNYDRLLLGLSGGLDSSITACALARQSTPWMAFTMATDEPTGDERRYARQVTHHLGMDLHEYFHELDHVKMMKSVSAHLPRPTARSFGQSQNTVVAQLVDRFKCDAHFTGTGGDNVFCYLTSATPIVDRFMMEGLSFGVWRTAQDICRLTGCSLWEALRSAYARSKHLEPKWGNPSQNRFLRALDASEQEAPQHPWLDFPDQYLPGKAVHVAMLARAHGVMTSPPVTAGFDYVMPLVAQPVVELCLSIPSWKWCEDGVNRSLARAAFRDWLPPSLINRRSKGGPSRFCHDVIEAQRQALSIYLLDGLLAAHGIIDTDAVKMSLSGRQSMGTLDHMDMSQLAEAESWARHWSAAATRRLALDA